MLLNGKIKKKSFIKLQNFSIKILKNYPTWTSSFSMHFSFDDLKQGDFYSETVIIHISLSSSILESMCIADRAV